MLPSTSKDAEKEPQESAEIENPENSEIEVEEEEIVVVAGEETVEREELAGEEEEEIYEHAEYVQYDPVLVLPTDRNMVFDMYQPQETDHGTFMCKICLQADKTIEYPDRTSFVAHRYKFHGAFNNNVLCPLPECRDAFASLYTLRRHLSIEHNLPVEIHTENFKNIGEFEKHRHLIELATGCRYMMHTKQPKYRRQVMHCAKSEHKLVLQTQKHRLPKERMIKEGSACPSVISYQVDRHSGQVSSHMQLFHVGHAPDAESDVQGNSDLFRPMDAVFPIKPTFWADSPMQFVQIDVHEMPTAVYGNKMYESILVMTCLKTRFIWARPLLESTRTAIGRILNSIFNEFGVPEGFSTTYHPTYIRDTMKSLESVYAVEMREVWNEPLPYSSLEQWVLEMSYHELGTRNRWVEQLQFIIMEYNQRPLLEQQNGTPFERMFNRKPPNLYHNGDREDGIVAKFRRFNLEMRKDEMNVIAELDTQFKVHDKVFLRKGITKPGRGNNTQFYFGFIGDIDPSNKYYPYKVHFSSNDSPWPSERNMFVWVSVFDLLPTIHQVTEMAPPNRRHAVSELLCTCDGVESSRAFDLSAIGKLARESSKCLLFRNPYCSNEMSKFCCKMTEKPCIFHCLYPENDESYVRMDAAVKDYERQKMIIDEKVSKQLQDTEPTRAILRSEMHRRRMGGEEFADFDMDDDILGDLAEQGAEPTEKSEESHVEEEEPIDIEEIDEEPVEEEHAEVPETAPEAADTSDNVEFRYADVSKEPAQKRARKRRNSESARKGKKPEVEEAPTPSRRASARRTIRPKNLNDYVD